MMSSINSLLNHESAAAAAAAAADERHPPASGSQPPDTAFDAADALTSLATLGDGQQYVRGLPSPTLHSHAPRRTSSIGSYHAPMEPSPPIELPLVRSPTLEQYRQGSQSPQEQRRRQSLISRSSPVPVLAPIQNLAAALHEQTNEEPPSTSIGQGREPEPSSHASAAAHPSSTDTPSHVENGPSTAHPEPTASSAGPQLEHQSPTAESLDADTLKAIEIAKQSDLGLRNKRTGSVAESVSSPVDTKAAPASSKKRSAPSSNPATKKKGTAKAMKPSKKRKIDPDDLSATRSVTPTSRTSKPKGARKGSQVGTPTHESSPAPDNSSQVGASDDDGESSEDHNLYCICKQPDNHRWMIGCDGGCEDWFHGDCISMKQADEDLVDKFICPNCEKNGKGNTTWKPMCRRDGCRKPARLPKDKESKYCSDDCGVLFMQEQLQRTAGAKGANGAKSSKKSKKKNTEGGAVADEEEPTPLGGVLRAKDLKALVDASPNIQAFKKLGTGVLSPPQTASPTRGTFVDGNGENLSLTAGETARLTALHKEKSQLQDRLEVLKDREKFVSMAKEQAVRVADREKIKMKEFCGYDSRLSWSDSEFLLWRNSQHGQASFKFSTLSPTTEQMTSTIVENGAAGVDLDAKETVCLKKRCPKHPQWQKLNLQDARFEELEVVEAIRECEKEERSVRERARRRGAKDGLAKELTAGDGHHEERNREGWVEMVA